MYLYLCMCICFCVSVFVYVYLYLCTCILVFVFVNVSRVRLRWLTSVLIASPSQRSACKDTSARQHFSGWSTNIPLRYLCWWTCDPSGPKADGGYSWQLNSISIVRKGTESGSTDGKIFSEDGNEHLCSSMFSLHLTYFTLRIYLSTYLTYLFKYFDFGRWSETDEVKLMKWNRWL